MPPPPPQDKTTCVLTAGAAGSGKLDVAFTWQGSVAVVHEVRCTIWEYKAMPGEGFNFTIAGNFNNPNVLSVGSGSYSITNRTAGTTYIAVAELHRNGQVVASSQTGYVNAP